MATKFITPSWRMPKNSNQSKASNYSLDFDGALNSEILLGNSTNLLPGQPSSTSTSVSNPKFSVSIFFQFKSSALGAFQWMVGSGQEGGATYWNLRKDDNDNLQANFRITNGAYATITGGTTLSHSTWYHACVTWDGNNINLYLNGTLDATQVAATTFYYGSTISHPTIGSFRYGGGNSAGNRWQGKLTQVSIFDYGLDSNAVTTLWGGGIPGNPLAIKPPIAYYNLGQGSAYAEGSAGVVEPNLAAATGSTVFEIPSKPGKKYIETNINNLSDIDVTDKITVSTWVNFDDVTVNAYNPIINKGQILNSSNLGFVITRTRTPSGKVYAQVRNNSSTTVTVYSDASTVSSGKWANIVMRYDGAHVKIYVDGKLYESAAQTGNILDSSPTEPVVIGSDYYYNAGLGNNLVGKVSNVQIWNTDLSDGGVADGQIATGDILTLYNNGTPLQSNIPQSGSLKAWYKLGLDNSAFNSDSTLWTVENNFTTPTYTEGLFYGGNYVGGSPSVGYTGMRLTNQTISSDHVTYSFWYKRVIPKSTGTSDAMVIAGTNPYLGVLNVTGTGGVQWVGDGASKYINFTGDVTDGAWHHILVYYPNGDTITHSEVKCYIDGALQTNSYIGGGSSSGPVTQIKGTLIESLPVAVVLSNWAYFLSDQTSNIDTIYNGGTPGDISSLNPDVWLKYNSATTSLTGATGLHYGIATDSSGNNNSGSLAGKTDGSTTKIISNTNVITGGKSSGMDSTNLVPSNLQKSIPYSGYSMNFDAGDSDYIEIPNNSSLQFSDQLTFSCWVKADNVSGTNTILDKYWLNATENKRSYMLRITSTTIRLSLGSTDGSSSTEYRSATTLSNDIWYNIITIFNGTDDEVNIYINGISDANNPHTKSDTICSNTQPLRIGAGYNLLNYFDGIISNVAVWNRAITQDEILRVYNGGSPGDLANLGPTSWWSLGVDSYFDGSNWICPDLSTNTNNGTSANMGAANLVGEGPDSLANGTSTNLDLSSDLVGEAPGSTGNAISINMNSLARTGSTP